MSSPPKCPVEHQHDKGADKCPVDHASTGSTSPWSRLFSSNHPQTPSPSPSTPNGSYLSNERETSSIPKLAEGNWVYPSEAQFFAAMARKNHNPQTSDMKTIVPIHNAVNERAWMEVMKWEAGRGSERCGGVKLVNFKGRPGERSLRARWKTLLG
jgi:cytochrome c heme-lyase